MADGDGRSRAEEIYSTSLQGADAGSILCELLDLHASETGQHTARHAGRILRGAVRVGRHSIDDTAALRRIAAFPPWRRRDAIDITARWLAGDAATEKEVLSIKKRLQRKRREQRKGAK